MHGKWLLKAFENVRDEILLLIPSCFLVSKQEVRKGRQWETGICTHDSTCWHAAASTSTFTHINTHLLSTFPPPFSASISTFLSSAIMFAFCWWALMALTPSSVGDEDSPPPSTPLNINGGGGGGASGSGSGNDSGVVEVVGLKHNPGIFLHWTAEEQAILEDTLPKWDPPFCFFLVLVWFLRKPYSCLLHSSVFLLSFSHQPNRE